MSKKIKIEIKSWLNGSVLFEYECVDNTIAKTVTEAVKNNANLSFANLRSADLSFADLRSADLSFANLRSANLSFANLSFANLRSANLRSADLSSADLRSANLSFANLRSADLSSADLRFADLSFADLSSANLSYADLRSANLSSADLSSADLSSANLRYANNINKYYATDLSSLLTNQPNRLIAYKYLTKQMQSPIQNKKITYKVGKEYTEKVDDNRSKDCGKGLNIASLEWCLKGTQGNLDDYIYIEVSFDPKDVVVPYFSDGKFRVSKLRVEKKLTKTFLKQYTEDIK